MSTHASVNYELKSLNGTTAKVEIRNEEATDAALESMGVGGGVWRNAWGPGVKGRATQSRAHSSIGHAKGWLRVQIEKSHGWPKDTQWVIFAPKAGPVYVVLLTE